MLMNCTQSQFNGRCCCNCQNQIIVRCHPWNKVIGKGSITEPMGYLCAAGEMNEDRRVGIFFESAHGMCELHTP